MSNLTKQRYKTIVHCHEESARSPTFKVNFSDRGGRFFNTFARLARIFHARASDIWIGLQWIGLQVSENGPFRLTTPCRIVERKNCFVVEDASGFALGHIFFADDEQRQGRTGQMSREEALRAANRLTSSQEARLVQREATEKIEIARHALEASLQKLH